VLERWVVADLQDTRRLSMEVWANCYILLVYKSVFSLGQEILIREAEPQNKFGRLYWRSIVNMSPYGEEYWLGVFSDPKPSYSSFLSPSAIIQLSNDEKSWWVSNAKKQIC
jgi:hypothetical protein